jgi:Flp pilus assembly protein TadG
MNLKRGLCDDTGATAIEMALTLPAFLMLLIGALDFGVLMWTQFGIQHGTEMAARCAVITPSTCSSSNATQTYAAHEAFGLNPPISTFTVSTPACGELVSASYSFTFVTHFLGGPLTLTASSCFPK